MAVILQTNHRNQSKGSRVNDDVFFRFKICLSGSDYQPISESCICQGCATSNTVTASMNEERSEQSPYSRHLLTCTSILSQSL